MSQFILIEELTEVLEAVEWAHLGDGAVACPWCKGWRVTGHYPDCPRQAALDHAHSVLMLAKVMGEK